jgi:septum formation inhibitor MinC
VARKRRDYTDEESDALPVAPVNDREVMVNWFKTQLAEIDLETKARIERLRTVGEHPSPMFQNLVQHHAAMGLTPKLIAKMLQIPYSTLMLHYDEDIEIGAASMNLKIAENMARIATSTTDKDAAKVGMAWLERRGGETWRQTKKLEIDDKRDKPPILDSSKLSPEERQQLREVIEAAIRSGQQITQDDSTDLVIGEPADDEADENERE